MRVHVYKFTERCIDKSTLYIYLMHLHKVNSSNSKEGTQCSVFHNRCKTICVIDTLYLLATIHHQARLVPINLTLLHLDFVNKVAAEIVGTSLLGVLWYHLPALPLVLQSVQLLIHRLLPTLMVGRLQSLIVTLWTRQRQRQA